MGKLYIVSTPIGNLEDMTLRAIRILAEADLILSEDTRRTGILLKHFKIEKPQLSYFEFNEEKRIPQVIEKLRTGLNIALVSDAGTPLISDPGFKLVRECVKLGIKVESIPGASAVLTALTVSSLPTDKFLFLGYLPKTQSKATRILENLKKIQELQKMTVILFESPHKLLQTLENLKEVFGDLEIVIARELTKIHQEIRREKISKSISHFQKTKPKGEFTLLF